MTTNKRERSIILDMFHKINYQQTFNKKLRRFGAFQKVVLSDEWQRKGRSSDLYIETILKLTEKKVIQSLDIGNLRKVRRYRVWLNPKLKLADEDCFKQLLELRKSEKNDLADQLLKGLLLEFNPQ